MIPIYERYGFHFVRTAFTTQTGENLSLVVKVKGRSRIDYPNYSVWEYSEDEYVDFINKKNIKCADIVLDDFSMLNRCPNLEILNLYPSYQAPNHISYEPVYTLQKLKAVQPTTVYYYDEHKTEYDCAKMASADTLEWFGADCKKGLIRNIDALTGLKTLTLSNYRYTDMTKLVNSHKIDTVELLRCGIESLDGLEKTDSLKVLSLSSCSKLRDINALKKAGKNLKGLIIESCSKIEDFSALESLTNLERISLKNTGTIPSVSFIRKLPKLKTVTISYNVLDGDLSYCDGLDYVSFQNRRHYNRKNEQYPKNRENFVLGDEEIEEWRRHVMR